MENKIITEQRNPNTMNLDELDTLSLVKVINNEDKKVAMAVEKELEVISSAVDAMSKRYNNGGRIIYCGAGTSGRLGVLDAVELKPTYNVPSKIAFGLMAGGKEAMYDAVEGAEDSKDLGREDISEVNLEKNDIVIGLAASGRTPYTIAVLEYANEIGALTIGISCNKNTEIGELAQFDIAVDVGPEVVTGSTRMKAGTSQKMVLNILSTATMVKSGKVYENLMINVQATNQKLVKRSINILDGITSLGYEKAKDLYEKSGENIPVALVMHLGQVSLVKAQENLKEFHGNVKRAVKNIKTKEG